MTQTQTASASVAVTVNGERREVEPRTTLAQLLRALDLDPRMIVVERNREILRDRDAFEALPLEDGDVLELVHFVGGG
ncbi:MAG TPA: sulfur carrier protein ThiS [Gemmatimonadaceae bacterium]|nr:sulfur carrier protein ThiS [Gemmatimonadaceae bacterium]